MSKKIDSNLFSAILYILIGVLLVIFRSRTIGLAMTIVGLVFIVSGILELVKKNFAGGAVSLIIGAAVLVLGWLAAAVVLLVLGLLIALKGVVALINELKKKQVSVLGILFPTLTVIVGLGIAFGNALDLIIVICGIILALDGVLGLIEAAQKKD